MQDDEFGHDEKLTAAPAACMSASCAPRSGACSSPRRRRDPASGTAPPPAIFEAYIAVIPYAPASAFQSRGEGQARGP